MFIAVFGILSISAAFTRDSMALSSTWIPTGRRSVATTVPPTAAAPTSGTTQPSSIATPSPAATTTHPIVRFIEFPPRRQRRRVAIQSDRLRQSRHRTGTVASDRRNELAGTAARPAAAAGAWCDRRWLPPARAARGCAPRRTPARSEEHTSELQSRRDLVCRLLLEKKKKKINMRYHKKASNNNK